MKTNILVFAVLSTFFLPAVLGPLPAAAGSAPPPSGQAVIGVILPFSSAFETIAAEQRNAIQMALAETDAPLEAIFKDGRDDPAGAMAAFEELARLENPPKAVISCASWASSAIHPLAAEKGIFHIAIGSAIIERTRPGHTVRFTIDARQEERQLAEFLSRFSRIAVFNMDNGYGNNWATILKEHFQEKIVASLAYDPTAHDFSPALARIQQINPDALVLLSAGNAARIAKQAREAGITAQLVGTRPIERPELLTEPATNGLVYTYPSYSFQHHLVDDYAKRYATAPTIFGIEAYDAMTTLARALRECRATPAALFAWYAGKTLTGALGEIRFDEKGDARYPYLYKEIAGGRFQIAAFQFPLLLEKTRQEIQATFRKMDEEVARTAGRLSTAGLTGEKARKALEALFENNAHAFDCAAVDSRGGIVAVAPQARSHIIGHDISGQAHIARLATTRRPVVSQAIDTLDGFVGFDLQHPVFDPEGEFIGSVGILTRPGFFDRIITQKVANFPVEIFMMQTDGRMIYDVNKEEVGRNLFTYEVYQAYPSLLKMGREMAAAPRGSGQYEFLDRKMETTVTKNLIWTTVAFHGTEFRLALAYEIP